MFYGLLRENADELPTDVRLLGLDHGTKTIGLSLSDSGQSIATPLKTIPRAKMSADIKLIQEVMNEFEIGALVFGYPLDLRGEEGPRAQSVRDYASELARQLKTKPVFLWDERLSTAAVDRFMIDTVDMSRTKRKQNVDKLAAHFILQGALDFLKSAHRSA